MCERVSEHCIAVTLSLQYFVVVVIHDVLFCAVIDRRQHLRALRAN